MSRRSQFILVLAGLCLQSFAAGARAGDVIGLKLPALGFPDFLVSSGPGPAHADPREPVVRQASVPAMSDIEAAGESDHPEGFITPTVFDGPVYGLPEGIQRRNGEHARIERLDMGAHRRFGQQIRLTGEVSAGEGSVGAQIGGSCLINERIQLYTNSGVDTKPVDGAISGLNGALTGGARWRVSEKAGVFAEERRVIAGGGRGKTHALGVDLRPAPHWTWGATLETGERSEPWVGVRQRHAGSLSAGFARRGIRYGGSLELEWEDGEGPGRSRACNARNDFELQMAERWRLLGRLNGSLSSASRDSSFEGAYVECLAALTHRRFDQDSFTVLAKHTFSPDGARDWQSGLQVGFFSPVNSVLHVGLGYNVDDFSIAGTEPSSDDRGWFLEIAGTF